MKEEEEEWEEEVVEVAGRQPSVRLARGCWSQSVEMVMAGNFHPSRHSLTGQLLLLLLLPFTAIVSPTSCCVPPFSHLFLCHFLSLHSGKSGLGLSPVQVTLLRGPTVTGDLLPVARCWIDRDLGGAV